MSGVRRQGVRNPMNSYRENYKQGLDQPDRAFTASSISSKEDQQHRNAISGVRAQPVTLPPHLFIPEDAQSVDLRNLVNVSPGETVTLLEFVCPKGNFVKFISYAVYFDALLFDNVNLVPTVNGERVFPYHGNPQRNYKIGLGTGQDLSNGNLIACQLDMQPGDVLKWEFTSTDSVDVAAGVRMVGYVDQSAIRKQGRFGG